MSIHRHVNVDDFHNALLDRRHDRHTTTATEPVTTRIVQVRVLSPRVSAWFKFAQLFPLRMVKAPCLLRMPSVPLHAWRS